MLNTKEINISSMSYTNKDFASIYPELIEFIQNITTKWDPQTSSETDPGVVLTKEMAFLGDKLNYNVDKNVLETFMPSCTQETSMRQNCESRGYEMSYYNSATTSITFTYTQKIESGTSFVLPAYKTVITSSDENVYYIITQSVEFNENTYSKEVPAIEGTLNTLTVASANDDTLIQLSNLDDNNRIYFPIKEVAQNGVFISNSLSSRWEITDNLNVEELGKPFYKFGYDSRKGLPYVEFPRDIANLIGNGLTINYVATKGKDGNVQANYLTQLSQTNAQKYVNNVLESDNYNFAIKDTDDPELLIKNNSASIDGSDMETIDEAYESYKRTIGTFNTLVTCRDYANTIYDIYQGEYPSVSNVHVADRRDDINYSTKYLSYDKEGVRYMNSTTVSVTPYDLCLYP